MRWEDRPGSSNVEDRRGMSSGRGFPSGFGTGGRRVRTGGIPLRGKTGVIVVLIVLVASYYGIDLTPLITGEPMSFPVPTQTQTQTQSGRSNTAYRGSAEEEKLAKFSSVALKTTEDVWTAIFKESGQRYAFPKLVLYTGSTPTACGYGQAAMGPFYCPADHKLYLDLSFYKDMQTKLGGGGDFALGYVLAHEVGHHVQTLIGISEQVQRAQQTASKKEANRIQVRMELQADCFAGVWGHYMQKEGILEAGDLQEALNTAAAIGDDRLQRQAGGRVVPDSFTHGTSEQRLYWFKRGFDTGAPGKCDTWNAKFE